MLNPLDPLSTLKRENPDYNASDNRQEIEFLFARQQAIDGMLSGLIPVDYVLDLLEFQGIDPHQYANEAIANMDHAIATGAPVDPDEVSLYLPCHF